MGEVKRYEPVVHHISGDTFADAVIDADGDYVLQSDYAALEAKLAASEAACAAKDAALRVLDAENKSVLDRGVIAAARALDAGRNWIDASGAVEATCFSHCEVIGREPFGTYRDVGRVEVPKDWAGSSVLIVRKP